MEVTPIRYSRELINDFEANNYFGEGQESEAIRLQWEANMAELGAAFGELYDQDEFDEMCMDALLAVNF